MPHAPDNFAVWFEIPVRDMSKAMKFYAEVFDTELALDTNGPNPVAFFPTAGGLEGPGISGHLYPGTPAGDGRGPTVHMAVPGRLEDAIARFEKAGGEVLPGIVPIPPGRFAYGKDPDGNSIGLFEPKRAA